jgi:hypothetical protein
VVDLYERASGTSVFDAVPERVRLIGTVARRIVLLFPVPPALIVGVAGAWNPWNVDVLESGLLGAGVLPLASAVALIGIELSLTFRSWLIRLVTLAVLCLGGLLVGLIVFVSGAVHTHNDPKETVAVSPDGRIRAVLVSRTADYSIDPSYSLELHLDIGFDRSTTILSRCTYQGRELPPVRFVGNRALEVTAPSGRVLRVRFDKNLNPDRVHQMC